MPDALVIVDFQNDFTPGGALAVPEGDAIAEPLNEMAKRAETVIATRDWHPPDHGSFEERGGPWPRHCVAGSEGAALHPSLEAERIDVIVDKGQSVDTDGYSGFDGTELEELLRERDIDRVVVGGLATDYCVLNTVLDARERGFVVTVVTDAIRGVEVNQGDSERALDQMRDAGARLATSDEVLR